MIPKTRIHSGCFLDHGAFRAKASSDMSTLKYPERACWRGDLPDHESRRSVGWAVPALRLRSICNVSPYGHARYTSMRIREP